MGVVRNPDEDLRRLERAAAAGDWESTVQLEIERERRGLLPSVLDWLIAEWLSFDVDHSPDYVPTAGVLATREFHRQYDLVRRVGETVAGTNFYHYQATNYEDGWETGLASDGSRATSGIYALHFGFRDNSVRNRHHEGMLRIGEGIEHGGHYKVFFVERSGDPTAGAFVPLNAARIEVARRLHHEYAARVRAARDAGGIRGVRDRAWYLREIRRLDDTFDHERAKEEATLDELREIWEREVGSRQNPDEGLRGLELAAAQGDVTALERLGIEVGRRGDVQLAIRVAAITGPLWEALEAQSDAAFKAARQGQERWGPRAWSKRRYDRERRRAFAINRELDPTMERIMAVWRAAERIVFGFRRERTENGIFALHEYVSPRTRPLTQQEEQVRAIAYGIKTGDPRAIETAAQALAPFAGHGVIVIPAPASAAYNFGGVMALAERIAQLVEGRMMPLVQRVHDVASSHQARREGGYTPSVIHHVASMSQGSLAEFNVEAPDALIVDNVAVSGATIGAMRAVLGAPVRAVVWAAEGGQWRYGPGGFPVTSENPADDRRRRAERALPLGDASDRMRVIVERLRDGTLDPWLVWAAAALGDEVSEAIARSGGAGATPGIAWDDVQDGTLALDDGWDFFESDNYGREVERDDEGGLESDEDAHKLIIRQAKAGSVFHIQALIHNKQTNLAAYHWTLLGHDKRFYRRKSKHWVWYGHSMDRECDEDANHDPESGPIMSVKSRAKAAAREREIVDAFLLGQKSRRKPRG